MDFAEIPVQSSHRMKQDCSELEKKGKNLMGQACNPWLFLLIMEERLNN